MRTSTLRSIVGAAFLAIAVAGCSSSPPPPEDDGPDLANELASLETEFDARVGISAIDTGSGEIFDHEADARFGYASTLKAFAAAEFLRQVDPEDRGQRVTWTQEDVDAAGYAPVTSEHVGTGLTLSELAEAAVRDSDNTAMNLILERIGGPAGLDAALVELGDATTEVVNQEPELNDVPPGSTDDTTTPAAFTADLVAYLDGSVLDDADRALLIDWMSDNPTGDSLVRAGAPSGWVVADKSGGAGAVRNDIAIVTLLGRDPIVITILTTKNDLTAEYDDQLVARAAELALSAFA